MRFYYNVLTRELVTGLGESALISEVAVKRRDGEIFELQLFSGVQGAAMTVSLSPSFEMKFTAKLPTNWAGPAVVMSVSFTYDEELFLYRAVPSFNTDRLLQHFLAATKLTLLEDGRDLATTDVGNLLIVESTGGETVNITTTLDTAATTGQKIFLCCTGAAAEDVLTITAAGGITINRDPDLGLDANEMLSGTYLQLRKTAANTWILEAPTEVEEVSLMAEFTWRELAEPLAWRSTDNFTLLIKNDVNRGDEGAPTTLDAASLFITRAELEGGYLLADTTEARYHRSDSAQTYTTGRQKFARDNMGLVLNTQALVDLATINWDMALGLNAVVTLGGNRTLAAPTNAPFTGASGTLIVIQDGTGGRSLTLNAAYTKDYLGNTLDTTAGSVSVVRWQYDGTKYRLSRVPTTLADWLAEWATLTAAQKITARAQMGVASGRVTTAYAGGGLQSSGTNDLNICSMTFTNAELQNLGANNATKGVLRFSIAGQATNTTTASNLLLWVFVGGAKRSVNTFALGTTAVPAPGREWRASGFLTFSDITAFEVGDIQVSLDGRWHTTDTLTDTFEDGITENITSGMTVSVGANVSAASSQIISARGWMKWEDSNGV